MKAIDLFSGAGGMALGLSMAGIEIIGLVERDKFCLMTLEANKEKAFPMAKIIDADIEKLSGNELMELVNIKKGDLDILSGGPPCQGFSFANSRNRSIDDPRSKMIYEFSRLINEVQPKVFIMENVRGLLCFKEFFFTLLETFENNEYIVRFNLINCASYGVSQNRIRVIITGCRKDINKVPVFPVPTHFDLINDKSFPPKSLIACKCFAVNGFQKEEIYDVCWNEKLQIMLNKKTQTEVFEKALHESLIDVVYITLRTL